MNNMSIGIRLYYLKFKNKLNDIEEVLNLRIVVYFILVNCWKIINYYASKEESIRGFKSFFHDFRSLEDLLRPWL